MAHYIGPKHKLARREGVNIIDKTSNSLLRRLSTPPGVHGKKKTTRRMSEFGIQLREKQKLKGVYGIMEKQLSRLVRTAVKRKGETGELLLGALETRLDNIVYRLGFAKSRFMARQMVSHGHISVNGKKLTIPSYAVRVGETINVRSKMQNNPVVTVLREEDTAVLPFLAKKDQEGSLVRMPTRSDVDVLFDTQLIIEYYSR